MKKYMNPVPERIKCKTYYYQTYHNMGLYDSFNLAVSEMTFFESRIYPDLYDAWKKSDFRDYIPQEYLDIALNEKQLAFKYSAEPLKIW